MFKNSSLFAYSVLLEKIIYVTGFWKTVQSQMKSGVFLHVFTIYASKYFLTSLVISALNSM